MWLGLALLQTGANCLSPGHGNRKRTEADIPDQHGKRVIVTGTGGLGFETARALAQAGAQVVIAGRNPDKGAAAVQAIRRLAPQADISFGNVDLASLASIAAFVEQFAVVHDKLDLLINNAGVMAVPDRRTTADGFELQFGTNHLGHFALTGRLLPLLRRADAARVVSVSSGAHRLGAAIHFDDLQWQRRYSPWRAYAQSKLAVLMFALELQRRAATNGWGIISNAAHPGFARTDLIANGPGEAGAMRLVNRYALGPLLSHSASDGALPTLLAATSPDARGGDYYGPTGLFEMKGPPGPARIGSKAKDEAAAARLWQVSEQLTGVQFEAS